MTVLTDSARGAVVSNIFKFTSRKLIQLLIHENIMPFYAVARGKQKGIYKTWTDCKAQIDGFKNAKYKKFNTRDEAADFIKHSKKMLPIIQQPIPTSDVSPLGKAETSSNSSAIKALETKILDYETKLVDLKEQLCILNYSQHNTPSDSIQNDTIWLDDSDDDWLQKAKIPKLDLTDLPSNNKSKFSYDKDGFVEVYTDGSCEHNGKANAKAGFGVYFGENHPLNASEPVSGRATNNCGEIQAAANAAKSALSAGVTKLCIYTDSQFMINAMTSWLPGWKKKNWMLASGGPVKNKEDFMELDKYTQKMTIKWTYVKAHAGIFGNERADVMAKAGADKYKIHKRKK